MSNESINTVNIFEEELIEQMKSALKLYLQSRKVPEEKDFELVITK